VSYFVVLSFVFVGFFHELRGLLPLLELVLIVLPFALVDPLQVTGSRFVALQVLLLEQLDFLAC